MPGDQLPDYEMSIIAPFSPIILRAKMPSSLVSTLNDLIDGLLRDAEVRVRYDFSAQLAGNVKTEVNIGSLIETNLDAKVFLIAAAREYIMRSRNTFLGQPVSEGAAEVSFKIRIADAWANDMVAGDFNPVHFHSKCQISCVGFLRVPDGYDKEYQNDKPGKNCVGCLQFIDGRTVPGGENLYLVKPVIGAFVLFPSWMLHCVYPFRSSGVRRSFSANIAVEQKPDKA